jgi:tetratricopeptide (TPR) repeat protein
MKWVLSIVLELSFGFHSSGFAQSNQGTEHGDAATHISQGVAFIRAGQPENALEEFTAANRLDPTSSQALVWVGITYNQLGHFQEAVAQFSEALKLDPGLQAAHYNLALSFARLGLRKNAIRELREVVKSSPTMSDAQYNLAVLLEEEGNPAEAISHLQAARRAQPNDVEIGLHLARDLFLTNRSTEGLEVAEELSPQNDNPTIAKQFGSMLVENGYFAEAVPLLETARNGLPASLELTSLLARAYIGSQSASEAIELLKPHETSDNSGATAYLLGLAYLSEKQPASALEPFRIAAERKPADPAVRFHLGALLVKSSSEADQNSGVIELQKAIDLAPADTEYYSALGRWLLEHNRVNDAISVLQRGEAHALPSAEIYVLLSVAEALTQSTRTQAMAEKAIALDPKMALAHDVLGFCYFRSGDYLRAAESYKTASDLSPQTGRFPYDTALALERANNPNEAVIYAERATKIDPQVSINHYLLGKLYSRLEKKSDSIRELETAVQLDPSLDYPYYLLARMYMRVGDTAKAQEWNRKLQELKKQQMTIHGVEGMSSERQEPPPLLLEKGRLDSDSAQH